jgi:hypothetical protein
MAIKYPITVIMGEMSMIFEMGTLLTINAAGRIRNTVVYVPTDKRCPIEPSLTPLALRKRLNNSENAANPNPESRLPRR